jgi:hypothetical protein
VLRLWPSILRHLWILARCFSSIASARNLKPKLRKLRRFSPKMAKLLRITLCILFYWLLIFRFVPKNFNAFVILELEDKLCLELYTNIKSLGRITLRAAGETLAAGVIMEFIAW